MSAQISLTSPQIDWSDVPFLLAVCEAGSLAGAARRLGVNHSTVYRRIEAVEARLGVRLFERQSHGYVMTPAGEHFFSAAVPLRDGLTQIEREIGGQDLRLEGPVTVTTTDSLLHCLAPVFADFQNDHPEVKLRILVDARALDLSRRDADIALRPTHNPPEHWVGKALAPIACATYAHESYKSTMQTLAPDAQRWLMLDDDLDQSPMSRITMRQRPDASPVTIFNTVMGLVDGARCGLGLAVLPTYLGDQVRGLVRVGANETPSGWQLWLLAHPDVRRSARVHAFYSFAMRRISSETFSGG